MPDAATSSTSTTELDDFVRSYDQIAEWQPMLLRHARTGPYGDGGVAAVQLGLVFVPIVHVYGPAELSFVLRQSGARALFVPDHMRNIDFAERVSKLRGGPALEHVVVAGEPFPGSTSWADLVDRGAEEAPSPVLSADDVCAMVYTSGTTSDPKGVQHTHNSLLAERGGVAALMGQAPQNVAPSLQLFPAGHIAGALGTIFMFASSTTTVAFEEFGPETAVAAIEEFKLASTAGPPVFLSGILDPVESGERDLSSLASFMVGAASVPPHLVERADALGIKAFRCYGSSDTRPSRPLLQPTRSRSERAQTDPASEPTGSASSTRTAMTWPARPRGRSPPSDQSCSWATATRP